MNKGGETVHTFWPGETFSLGFMNSFATPTRRTEYFSVTGPDVLWSVDYSHAFTRYSSAYRSIGDNRPESTVYGRAAIVPGQFRPGAVPNGLSLVNCAVCRQGDTLYVLPKLVEGDPRHGYGSTGRTTVTRLSRDGVEIPTSGRGGFPLSPESGRYRLEYTSTETNPLHRYGPVVRTVWDFTATARPTVNEPQPPYQKARVSDANPAAWQPVIFLNYEFPLFLDNTALAGLPLLFTVRASAGKPGSAKDVAALTLRVSFDDGKTWADPWFVRRTGDGQFQVLLNHPRFDRTTGAVTLQVRAWDRAGNSVSQTVSRAYGLVDLWHRDSSRTPV